MAAEVTRDYSKLDSIILDIGVQRIREQFTESLTSSSSFRESLNNKKPNFDKLLKDGILSDHQHKIIFKDSEEDEEEPNIDEFDITLLVVIIQILTLDVELDLQKWLCYPKPMKVSWKNDAVRLRNLKAILASEIQPTSTLEDYILLKNSLMTILIRLGVPLNDIEEQTSSDGCHTDFISPDDDYFTIDRLQRSHYCKLRAVIAIVATERIKYHVLQNLCYETLGEAVEAEKTTLEELHAKMVISDSQYKNLFNDENQILQCDFNFKLWLTLAEHCTNERDRFLRAKDRRIVDGEVSEEASWVYDVLVIDEVREYLCQQLEGNIEDELFENLWMKATTALKRLGTSEDILDEFLQIDFFGMNTIEKKTAEGSFFQLMSRSEWGARDPSKPLELLGPEPAQYFIISHVVYLKPCTHTYQCCRHVLNIQRYHITEQEFFDVAYNYLVGNDGVIYEGRGAQHKGSIIARGSIQWNAVSLSIAFVGEYEAKRSANAIKAMRQLLSYLVSEGRLAKNFIVYGLRQIRSIHDAPKMNLYEEIQKWPEWQDYHENTTAAN